MENKINDIIQQKLSEIEKKENVRILHCVESGSRAWGFASPDSDYDVRFIYLRPREFYLRLDKTRDVIEWQLDDTLDINGWDIQKTLRLLYTSNPTVFEWKYSPIVYRTSPEWNAVNEVIDGFFDKKKGLYHYLSTAKGNYRDYLLGETVRLKKYFYVLRPILACKWILEKGTPPPVLFDDLVEACLEPEMRPIVDKLVKLKRETLELGEGKRIGELNDYLDENIQKIDVIVKSLPHEDRSDGWDVLNQLFLSLLK